METEARRIPLTESYCIRQFKVSVFLDRNRNRLPTKGGL